MQSRQHKLENLITGLVLILGKGQHSTYFGMSRPLLRRIYEICRQKYGGLKPKGKISISNLHTLVGSGSSVAKFRCDIRELIQTSKIPGFTLTLHKSIIHINKTPEQLAESNIKDVGPTTCVKPV